MGNSQVRELHRKEKVYMVREEFYTGKMFDAYEYFGAHPIEEGGYQFRVYAPNAKAVEVIGEFNDWGTFPCFMKEEGESGVYECEVAHAKEGMMYKYRIHQKDGRNVDRADPYGFFMELRPNTASILTSFHDFILEDEEWMKKRKTVGKYYDKPLNIYEMHMGSWRRKEDGSWYSYEEIAELLIPYLKENHYTHVEVLPLAEHPLDASWGYQVSAFFAVTSRYGTPKQFMKFVNECHKNEIGVIVDFVPVHFVKDEFALSHFDGTALYEYPDLDSGLSEWGSCNFNYYRGEVRTLLQSAANYWITNYHIDGLRMDAISNAIYWQGDQNRGVNQGAIEFIQEMNEGLHKRHSDVILIAEDSTNFPKVTMPVSYGGLGFDYKWDMGWMNDTLKFFELDPKERKDALSLLYFSMEYFQNEFYLLPLSHDEVVHGKKTILDKMWGNYEEKFAQCRTLYFYLYTHSGKKLDFMGNEFGQFREWREDREQDFMLLNFPMHKKLLQFRKDLHKIYQEEEVLYQEEYKKGHFTFVPVNTKVGCVLAYKRTVGTKTFLMLCNMSDIRYERLCIVEEEQNTWVEMLNTDEEIYGGLGFCNKNPIIGKRQEGLKKQYHSYFHLAPFSSGMFYLCEGNQ